VTPVMALDLANRANDSGGLSNVATVVVELFEGHEIAAVPNRTRCGLRQKFGRSSSVTCASSQCSSAYFSRASLPCSAFWNWSIASTALGKPW
jgi:hypothetical protein